MRTGIESGETKEIRIIVSFEHEFHAYQETLAVAIRILRPDVEVMTVNPEEVAGAAKRFRPDVVIGSPLDELEVGGVPAWVELSLDPSRASRLNVNGYYSEMVNPTLDNLLLVIEEVARPH